MDPLGEVVVGGMFVDDVIALEVVHEPDDESEYMMG